MVQGDFKQESNRCDTVCFALPCSVLWCLCGSTGKASAVPLSCNPSPVLITLENISGRGVECGDDGTKVKRPSKEAMVGFRGRKDSGGGQSGCGGDRVKCDGKSQGDVQNQRRRG